MDNDRRSSIDNYVMIARQREYVLGFLSFVSVKYDHHGFLWILSLVLRYICIASAIDMTSASLQKSFSQGMMPLSVHHVDHPAQQVLLN